MQDDWRRSANQKPVIYAFEFKRSRPRRRVRWAGRRYEPPDGPLRTDVCDDLRDTALFRRVMASTESAQLHLSLALASARRRVSLQIYGEG